MHNKKTLWMLLLLSSFYLSISASPAAERRALENDLGSWLTVSMKAPIYKRLQGYFEVQPRFQKNHEKHLAEFILRPGIGFQLTRKLSVFAGYYWSAHYDPEYNAEHRLWQQVGWNQKGELWTIQNRFRVEETWRQAYEGPSLRVRNQLRVTRPIAGSAWYFATSDEPFVNINTPDKGPEAGFTQNRLFIGLGRRLNKFTRVEVGYMNQYRNSRSKSPDKVNHLLIAQLNFDFAADNKKKETKLADASNRGTLVSCVPQVYLPGEGMKAQVLDVGATPVAVAQSRIHPALHTRLSQSRTHAHI